MPRKIHIIESAMIPEFLRIPYKDAGRHFDGANCWGTIMLWYKMRFGVELMDIERLYDERMKDKGVQHFIENYYKSWSLMDKPVINDVVLLRINDNKVDHGGIILSDGRFLHTCKAGTVINRLEDPYWKPRIEGYYRYLDNAHNS